MKFYSIILGLLIFTVGCSSDDSAGIAAENTFNDIVWKLTAVRSDSGNLTQVEQEAGFEFTISFSSDPSSALSDVTQGSKAVSGINVCNHFGGSYTLESNVLNMFEVSEDAAFCERAIEAPAEIFRNVLFSPDNSPMFSVGSNVLTIESSNNEALIFTGQ